MPTTAVLVPPAETAPIVRMCCHCRRVWTADGWRSPPEPPRGLATHGICRECFVIHYPEFPVPQEVD